MAFSTSASTTTLKPFDPICQNNSTWMQHSPNLSFYNQLPPTSQGIEDPSKYPTIYDPTNEYYNISMNMQSGQSAMQDSEISRFQDKEYHPMAIAHFVFSSLLSDFRASDLTSTSINVQYHGNSRPQKSSHMAALQRVSTSTNTIMREKKFLNIQNSAYRNIESIDSYSIPDSGKGFLDCRQGMNEIPHDSYKSHGQLADNLKLQNVFQCHFCRSYQRDLKEPELPANSRSVLLFKCNDCIESTKLKEKIQPCPNLAEVGDEISDLKLQKKMKPSDKQYLCNLCSKRFTSKSSLKRHILTHTGEKPYPCEVCDKRFSQTSSLKQHTLTHTGVKPFSCEICGKTFAQTSNLKKHVLTHTGVKPFSCEICGKTFSRKDSKDIHTLTHPENKRFQCNMCGRSFNRNDRLLKHKRKHH